MTENAPKPIIIDNLSNAGISSDSVNFPEKADEIVRLFKQSQKETSTIAIYGNGTQISCGGPAKSFDLALSTSRLNRIIEHDINNLTVTVESGIEFRALQQELKTKGQYLPLDPFGPDRSTIGGIVALNASGPRRFHYGTCRDLILGMTYILPDATQAKIGGKTMKNVAGFEIAKLFIGSMGTLGVIDQMTFRLFPTPREEKTIRIEIPDVSGVRQFQKTALESRLVYSSFEILNSEAMRRIGYASNNDSLNFMVRFEGDRELVDYGIEKMSEIAKQSVSGLNQLIENDFWEKYSKHHQNKKYPAVLKVSIPVSRTAEAIQLLHQRQDKYGIEIPLSGHAGNGILFAYIDNMDMDQLKELIESIRSDITKIHGQLTVYRADEGLKKEIDIWDVETAKKLELYAGIKKLFDPDDILVGGRFIGGL